MINLWVWEFFILVPNRVKVTKGQGHLATKAGQNLAGPYDEVRTTRPIATKHGRFIPLPCFAPD